MISRFARDAATYGGTAIIVRATSFVLLPIYTRFISPSDFGMIDLLLIVGAFAFVTVALEVGQGATRFLPEADSARRADLVGASLAFAVPAYVAFAIALALLAEPVATVFLGQPDAADLVRIAAITIALLGVFQLAHGQLRSMMQPVRFAIANIGAVVAGGITGVTLVVLLGYGPAGFFVGLAAGAIVGLLLVVLLGKGMYSLHWNSDRLAEMLRFSLPLVPASVAVILMASVDRLIINSALQLEDVGIYGVGLRIASIVGVVMVAFRASLTPLVYASYREPQTPRVIERLFSALVVCAGSMSIVIAMFAGEIVAIVAGPQFAEARTVVPLLATSTVVGSLYIFAPGLAIAQRSGIAATVAIAAAVVTTVAGLILIPAVGLVGGAMAALLGGTTLFAGHVILGGRHYPIPFSWPRTLAVGAVVLIVVAAAGILDPEPMSTILLRVLVAGILVGIVLLVGPIRPSDLRDILAHVRERSPIGPSS